MKLGMLTNGISCEFEMQDALKIWLKENDLIYQDEVHVKEVSRRADFLVLKRTNGLINIEAKCNDFYCMIKQMNDHAKYCDYCFAFIPDYALTTKDFKKRLLESGYGLIIYNYNTKTITEVLEAHFNRPKNKKLRYKLMEKIEKDNLI